MDKMTNERFDLKEEAKNISAFVFVLFYFPAILLVTLIPLLSWCGGSGFQLAYFGFFAIKAVLLGSTVFCFYPLLMQFSQQKKPIRVILLIAITLIVVNLILNW